MRRLLKPIIALLCGLSLVLGFSLAQAASVCRHGPANSATEQGSCPCCDMAALAGAACAFACQPTLQPAHVSAAPQSAVVLVVFAALDQKISGRADEPPEPPPRGDCSFAA